MTLRLFNTLGRRLEELTPLEGNKVRMYTCGPTVYDYPHIGNFRTFVFEDVLRRYLKYKGYRVVQVMNITDVDDKTIRGAREEGVSLKEYTQRYTEAFFEDLDALGIERAEHYPRATEHIPEMLNLIGRLLEGGYAYTAADGSVYYDISKFKGYGALSGLKIGELKPGARVKLDSYSKEEAQDFALWKAWDEEDGDVYWTTEFGRGRPGWHIECSAMAMKYLGESLDIHVGGVDLIFPHNENEIAQSEAASGRRFVTHWVHVEHLIVEGRKMAKSLGNYYTLRDALSRGYGAKALRFLLLSAHYRTQLNFTFESLRHAEASVARLNEFMSRVKTESGGEAYNEELRSRTVELVKKFEEAMDDDLNTPAALAALFEFIRDANRLLDEGRFSRENLGEIMEQTTKIDDVLGVLKVEEERLPQEMIELVQRREEARRRKDWGEADRIRSLLYDKGIALEDTPQGVRWKKRKPS